MNLKIKVGGATLTLNDKSYLASGGEGSIYSSGGKIYKVFHDSKRILPQKKIHELSSISNPHVIIPQDVIFDVSNGHIIGYVTNLVSDSNPLLKYFTKTFKNDNNVSPAMILDLIKKMQVITGDIHKSNCLVVDYNELNILVKEEMGELMPYYIDCDSYQTPSFKSSAVMTSIMDRRVSKFTNGHLEYHPDEMSDWFSWGVLSFYALINIHPFRAAHPNYRPNQKEKQMDDNVSVFDPKSRMPPSTNPLSIIPTRLLDWYKFIFKDIKNRSVPPLPDSSVPLLVPTQIITIQGTDKLGVEEIAAYSNPIMSIMTSMGVYYIATKTHIYANQKEIGQHKAKKILLVNASDGTLITAQQDLSNKIQFKELTKADPTGTATSDTMFARNNAIYTISKGKLVENSFAAFGNKMVHRVKEVENLSVHSATVYDGCVIQDLLGKMYLTLPYKLGSCFSKYVQPLDGYRVIEAKSDKNIVIIIAEKKGQFDEFILIFNKDYSSFDIRKIEDVTFDTINVAVGDNGLCLLLVDGKLEIFASTNQSEAMDNPPFDSSMPLFSTSDGFFFINKNSFHQVKKV